MSNRKSIEKADVEEVEVKLEPSIHRESRFTPAEEKRLVRKLDLRIMPVACVLYLFAFLDRSNMGNARLLGLPEDVLGGDPTGKLFDWVNSAFFFSYVLCQVPSIITSKLFSPRLWTGCAAVGWGIASTLTATGFNFAGLIVARVALSVFETGFGPGIPLYLSFWYTRAEIGMRLAFFFGFAAVSGAFGGLIAFGVQQAHTAIAPWRLLFIVEGIPPVLLGFFVMWFLPDRPEETTFLTEDERKLQLERMHRGTAPDVGRTITRSHISAAFRDWRIYAAGIIFFAGSCGIAAISAFLPTIIKTFGYTNARAQLFSVPPYAVSAAYMCMISYFSDRIRGRGAFVVLSGTLAAVGSFLLLFIHDNNHIRYFATFCLTCGTYAVIAGTNAWFAHNLGSETKKATGMPMYMSIGQTGSILGSHIFPATEGPLYIRGFAIICALELLGAISAGILMISFKRDNLARDRQYGRVEDPDAPVDTRELADKAPMFRYLV